MKNLMTTLLIMFVMATGSQASAGTVTYTPGTCDQVINNTVYTVCYSYTKNAALYANYTLDGTLVNKLNIRRHYGFHGERKIPRAHRVYGSYYRGTSATLDRGHLAPDAAFDYDKKILRNVYSMANIIPQYKYINRYTWSKAERRARDLAVKYGKVDVLNGVVYPTPPLPSPVRKVAMPSAYWKMIYTPTTSECYWYDNIPNAAGKKDRLVDHLVKCSNLPKAGVIINP